MTCCQRTRSAALAGTLLALVLAGCGGSKDPAAAPRDVSGATVSGVLVQGGKALKFKPDEKVVVAFSPTEGEWAGKDSYTAEVKPEDATFTLAGPSNKGIPAGKYKVTVLSEVYGGGEDRFAERLSSDQSQMIADVGGQPGQMFEIDVGRGTIEKK